MATKTSKRRQAVRHSFTPRIRFNWGFHDGAADQRSGFVALWNRGPVVVHHDPIYVAGYQAGQDAVKAGEDTSSSQPAWDRAVWEAA